MSSRLSRITNWEELAEEASYNAKMLAAKCGVSIRQLERVFLVQTLKSPQQWLDELRLQRAIPLIEQGLSVKEISFRLGYKQSSHFSRAFKRFHGVAPTGLFPPAISICRSEIRHVALR
jgi:AraC-like DNA-binding protein